MLSLVWPIATSPDPKFPADLTLFLLGSGIAFLIALLAWGEQIRSLAKDTRDLQRQFQDKHNVHPGSFRTITDPSAKPVDRIFELAKIVADGTVSEADQFALLQLFLDWKPLARRLNHQYQLKYRLTVLLTIALLVTGLLSVWLPSDARIGLCRYTFSFGRTCFVLVGSIITYQLGVLIVIARTEKRLNALLTEILERL